MTMNTMVSNDTSQVALFLSLLNLWVFCILFLKILYYNYYFHGQTSKKSNRDRQEYRGANKFLVLKNYEDKQLLR